MIFICRCVLMQDGRSWFNIIRRQIENLLILRQSCSILPWSGPTSRIGSLSGGLELSRTLKNFEKVPIDHRQALYNWYQPSTIRQSWTTHFFPGWQKKNSTGWRCGWAITIYLRTPANAYRPYYLMVDGYCSTLTIPTIICYGNWHLFHPGYVIRGWARFFGYKTY